MKNKIISNISFFMIMVLSAGMFYSCNEVSDSLAPYAGRPDMSNVIVEQNTYTPSVTWVGGYVSVIGINKGADAALDSSLIWLVYEKGDALRYPLKYGKLPDGASDLTSQYGDKTADSLSEDETYTFWVMKEDAWNVVSSGRNSILSIDTSGGTQAVISNQDTITISSKYFTKSTINIDRWINIKDVIGFGPLAAISIKTTYSNNPVFSWKMNDPNAKDTLISAMGIVEGQDYQSTSVVWEVYSVRDSSGTQIYGKDDIIGSPAQAGESVNGTHVFVQYPAAGLERNKNYYLWIANKDWDGVTRQRFATGYSYITFSTY